MKCWKLVSTSQIPQGPYRLQSQEAKTTREYRFICSKSSEPLLLQFSFTVSILNKGGYQFEINSAYFVLTKKAKEKSRRFLLCCVFAILITNHKGRWNIFQLSQTIWYYEKLCMRHLPSHCSSMCMIYVLKLWHAFYWSETVLVPPKDND